MALTKLYALTPERTERGVFECATSYLTYLMVEHRLRINSMFEYLVKHAPTGLPASVVSGKKDDESSFDGVGKRAQALIATLGALTGVTGLDRLTLVPLATACAGNGMGILYMRRRWCAAHFEMWHASHTRPFIPLTWRIAAVHRCVECGCRLEEQCPYCQAPQLILPRKWSIDRCGSCGKFLFGGRKASEDLVHSSDHDLEHWIAEQVTLVLGDDQYGLETIQDAPVASFFTQLLRLHGIGPIELGRRVGLHCDTIKQWSRGRTRPRLDLLLAVLAELSVPFRLMLSSPHLAASQALVPDTARRQIASSRKGVRRRSHNRDKVRSDVRKLIKSKKGVVKVDKAAETLDIPVGSLTYLAGDLLRAQRRKRA